MTGWGSRYRAEPLIAAAAVIAALSAPVAAAAAAPTFKEEYAAGVAAFKAGDFEKALVQFEKAYRLTKVPLCLFGIAQAHRKLGHFDDAIDAYEKFLATKPAPDLAKEVSSYLAEMRAAKEAARVAAAVEAERERVRLAAAAAPHEPAPPPASSPALSADGDGDADAPAPRRAGGGPGVALWIGLGAGAVVVAAGVVVLVVVLGGAGGDRPGTDLGYGTVTF